MQDVPEIDGIVYIENDKNLEAKDYLNKFIKEQKIDIRYQKILT